jgi:hypothetical protein
VNELRDRIVRAAECITNEMLANTWQKLNIVLCVVPLMVPTVTSTEHIRNFVRYSVWKCIDFCNTLYGERNMTFFRCQLRRDYMIQTIEYISDSLNTKRHVLSSTARTLGSWVRILLEAWMCVCFFFCIVLSGVGNGLATG